MPNIPSHGAAGGLNAGDKPPVGKQEHGPNSPSHGAAGGYEIDFGTYGAPPTAIRAGQANPPAKPFDVVPRS
jgi:hypothetical protein